jgi:chemotaxis signal transduction protein
MLKTPRGPSSKGPEPWPLVVFRVGGQLLAAKAQEVGGVWPWSDPMPVPSGTPLVRGIVRRGEEILPVYDLADSLDVEVKGARRLCLIAKHRDGPMAICIDEEIPSLQTVDPALIGAATGESHLLGTCQVGAETVSIYSLATLNGPRG